MIQESENNDCCCCEGATQLQPSIENRPGLSSIKYRAGNYNDFKSSMLVGLTKTPIQTLTTRSNEDLGISLIDAWAVVSDVLTFYQERIANEAFLRTSTELKSVLELANTVGYQLRPGVAAQTYLSFTIDESQGPDQKITIDSGTKVQSIPAQNQKPQIFETIESIEARPVWNNLKLRLTRKNDIPDISTKVSDISIALEGINLKLKTGDGILVVNNTSGVKSFLLIKSVSEDKDTQQTTLYAAVDEAKLKDFFGQYYDGIYVFRLKCNLFGYNSPIQNTDWDLFGGAISDEIDHLGSFMTHVENVKIDKPTYEIFPRYLPRSPTVYLDNSYPTIINGSPIILKCNSDIFIDCANDPMDTSLALNNLSGKSTFFILSIPSNDGNVDWKAFTIRKTIVYAQPEKLTLAEVEYADSLSKKSYLTLDGPIPDLKNRTISISGLDNKGNQKSVIAKVNDSLNPTVPTNSSDSYKCTKILLGGITYSDTDGLPAFTPESVTVNANVAEATHGETKQEILGNGDRSQKMQQFLLKQNPLTYVQSTTPSGAKNTLQISVNNFAWNENASLFDLSPSDESFNTRINENGQARVIFGDGIKGQRLPTGIQNITAKYRVGIGTAGNIGIDQIKMLMTRPLGVTGVTNSIPAGGGQDPDGVDEARENTPKNIKTLDRVVSLSDFEDFALSFAGVGKAHATQTSVRGKKAVQITIASSSETDDDNSLIKRCNDLTTAIYAVGDSTIFVSCIPAVKRYFEINVQILPMDGTDFDFVKSEVEKNLSSKFSYDTRKIGQRVTSSEILAIIQEMDLVSAANLVSLHYRHGKNMIAEELMIIDPKKIRITKMAGDKK